VSYSHAHFKRYRPRVPMFCSMLCGVSHRTSGSEGFCTVEKSRYRSLSWDSASLVPGFSREGDLGFCPINQRD
jgi:hypothetical protein